MSYHSAAQNAVMNMGAGTLATNAYNNSITQSSSTGSIGLGGTIFGQAIVNEDQHIFNCQKVENGWTFTYRNKTHIASTVDEMMEQMKAAMVIERIEK